MIEIIIEVYAEWQLWIMVVCLILLQAFVIYKFFAWLGHEDKYVLEKPVYDFREYGYMKIREDRKNREIKPNRVSVYHN